VLLHAADPPTILRRAHFLWDWSCKQFNLEGKASKIELILLFFGQSAILLQTAFTRLITECGCQNGMKKSAKLQHMLAGQTIVLCWYAKFTARYIGTPKHKLYFDIGL
jgi:hypothetical protein